MRGINQWLVPTDRVPSGLTYPNLGPILLTDNPREVIPVADSVRVLPKYVSVLGQKFTIQEVDCIDDDPQCCGQLVGDEHRIDIRSNMSPELKWRTLIHEVIHATLHMNGLASKLDDTTEEVIAQSVEYAMCQLIRQTGLSEEEIGRE